MSTAIVTAKSTGLATTGAGVKHLANRLERARQSRNEKIARADVEYVAAVKRAIADVEETTAIAEEESTAPEAVSPAEESTTT